MLTIDKPVLQYIAPIKRLRKSAPRRSAFQIKSDATKALIAPLERCIADIRAKIRETPSWEKAYCSAITTLELEIQSIKDQA